MIATALTAVGALMIAVFGCAALNPQVQDTMAQEGRPEGAGPPRRRCIRNFEAHVPHTAPMQPSVRPT